MSRSGCASIWRRISPRVSSVELPSTKISSVGTPKSGTRSISSAMWPCSFLHAQTIDTLFGPRSRGSGRATIQFVTASRLISGRLPTKPFRNVVRNGICFGKRIRVRVSTGSNPASSSRLHDVVRRDPVAKRLARLQPQELGEPEHRPPDAAVRVDDHPGALVRVLGDAVEELEQVVHVRHQVREDDVVERLAELQLLAGDALEPELWVLRPRAVDHPLRDVDADADARLQRGEQVARARADLEHPGVFRDVEAHHLGDQPVVRAVPALPAGLLAGEPVEELRQLCVGVRRHALGRGDCGGHEADRW